MFNCCQAGTTVRDNDAIEIGQVDESQNYPSAGMCGNCLGNGGKRSDTDAAFGAAAAYPGAAAAGAAGLNKDGTNFGHFKDDESE